MSPSIPLISKRIVSDFLKQLPIDSETLAQLQDHTKMPFALDTSEAQFIPFGAFECLLSELSYRLGSELFISTLQNVAMKSAANMQFKQLTANEFLVSFGLRDLIIDDTGKVLRVQVHSSHFRYIEAELFLIVYLNAYLKSQYPRLEQPCAYFLMHPYAERLSELNIRSDIPQFLGQANIALEYPKSDGVQRRQVNTDRQSFAFYTEQALAAYIGRIHITLDDFSERIGISKRTIQRSLKLENTSFRKIKDTLNFDFAKRVLVQRNSAVGDIAIHLGYADATQFVRAFKKANGQTPLQWKKANQLLE